MSEEPYFNVRESDWSIRTVERLCHEASDQLIISGKNLTGCNPEFSTYELPMESATSLPRIGTKGSPAIHLFNERDGRWVDLHDLYRLETCPNCNDTRLLVMNVRRALMLCNVVRCARMSHLAIPRTIESRDRLGDGDDNDDDDRDRSLLSHLAHSLIPQEFHHHRDEGMTKASSKSSSDGLNRSAAIIPTK